MVTFWENVNAIIERDHRATRLVRSERSLVFVARATEASGGPVTSLSVFTRNAEAMITGSSSPVAFLSSSRSGRSGDDTRERR
jgi:hypothetical protein